MLPDERCHDPLRWIRECSKMIVAPIPSDTQRNLYWLLVPERVDVDVARAPCGLFAGEVLLDPSLPCRRKISRPVCCMVDSLLHCAYSNSKLNVVSNRAEESNGA